MEKDWEITRQCGVEVCHGSGHRALRFLFHTLTPKKAIVTDGVLSTWPVKIVISQALLSCPELAP